MTMITDSVSRNAGIIGRALLTKYKTGRAENAAQATEIIREQKDLPRLAFLYHAGHCINDTHPPNAYFSLEGQTITLLGELATQYPEIGDEIINSLKDDPEKYAILAYVLSVNAIYHKDLKPLQQKILENMPILAKPIYKDFCDSKRIIHFTKEPVAIAEYGIGGY